MSAVTHLRKQEEVLDAGMLLAAIDACPESVAIIENGRVLYAAKAFARTLGGLEISELRGRALEDLLPKTTRYRIASEGELKTSSTPILIEALFSDFHANQRAMQVVSIRPAAQEQMEAYPSWESQKMEAVGRLLGGVAHDFNNLLTGIMLYCDLLIAGLEGDNRLRRHAQAIHKAGSSGAALIQQMLTLSREEPVHLETLTWNEVIADMKSLLTRLIGENIELHVRPAQDLGTVMMDRGQARQIILNLVLNARDAMPEGGKITLSTRDGNLRVSNPATKVTRSVPCAELSVTDNGTGMHKETLARIFRPYFTTKPRGQGTGLGLATVQRIVKKAGGEIQVRSELGQGTRVSIRVPRAKNSGNSQLSLESCLSKKF